MQLYIVCIIFSLWWYLMDHNMQMEMMYADEVMHSATMHYKLHIWLFWGCGGERMHIQSSAE